MRKKSVRVRDVLQARDAAVTMIKPSDTIGELCRQLQRLKIGAMVVSSDGESLDGIISERDVAYGLAMYRGTLHTLPVSQLMTKQVFTVLLDDKIADVGRIMAERRIRHVPVLEEGRIVGVLSMRDVTAHRLEEILRMADLMKQHLG